MSTTGPNLQNIPIRTPEGARIRGLFVNHTMDMTDAIMAEVDRITRELEAYRKAKAENDERFMIERDEARREVDRLTLALTAEQDKRRAADAVLAEIGWWCVTHGASLKPGGGDSDTFGDGMRAAKDQIRRVLFRNLKPHAGEPSLRVDEQSIRWEK